ncbi:MAG TPA: ABC transporter permease [Burkholderiaceae bacterium]
MNNAWVVFTKELRDALRDRRTLMAVVLSSVLMGPLVLFALSALVAGSEQRAESREILVAGLEHAPSLRNFLERNTLVAKSAPADFEQQMIKRQLGDAVLVVPPDFEALLARGDRPVIEVVNSSASPRASAAVQRLLRALQGFTQEQALLRLAYRGVAPALLEPVKVQERDLADPRARAAQLTGIVPFFVLMAVLYGALNAALDTTAGERERGSLEPLLMTPASRLSLVVGKWGAVAAVGMLIAVLSCLSFLPTQNLMRSETLAALFRFGLREAALFLALLLPLAATLSALMMAIAIRCKTFKEAQASNTIVILGVSLLPLLSLFSDSGEQPWHVWVPALAQITLMGRVLRGEAFSAADLLVPLAVAALLAAACLAYIARRVHAAATR